MMTTIQLPPGNIQFLLSNKTNTKVNDTLLPIYTPYSVTDAKVQYTEGNFGCFFQQELHNNDWLISWKHLFLKHSLLLDITSQLPVVAFQLNMKGPFRSNYGPLVLSPTACSLLYMPSQSKHCCYFKKGIYEMVYISFSSRYLEMFMDQHPMLRTLYENQQKKQPGNTIFPRFQLPPIGMEILHKIRHCNQQDSLRQFRLHCWISELLLLYFTAIEQTNKPAANHKVDQENRLKNVEEYIKKNYQLRITIPELSRIAGLNTTSFEKRFKELFARNPREYLEYCRIQQAAHLLKTTMQSVKEITYAIGFSDPNYFSQVFRKHFNCTPIAFRKKGNIVAAAIGSR